MPKKKLVLTIVILFISACIFPNIYGNVGSIENKLISGQIQNLNYGNKVKLIFYPTDDAILNKTDPNKNYGNLEYLQTRNDYGSGGAPGFQIDSLIKFNLSKLSPYASVISAILKLYYFDWAGNNPAGRLLNLYAILTNWIEENATWNNQPAYTPLPTSNRTVPSIKNVWMSCNVTKDVKGFINGSSLNYGWKITDETYWGNNSIPIAYFRSKDYGNFSPYLEIELKTPDIVFVDDDFDENTPGWGYDHFNKIQDGINSVIVNGTVFVYNGTYYENVIINKSNHLIGENRNTSIIDGNGNNTVIITANNVIVESFTICNATIWSNDGILLQNCSENKILDCDIYNNGGNGIRLYQCNYTMISNCSIHHNQYYHSVFLIRSSWNTIQECNLSWNVGGGACLWHYSNNNTITKNLITKNGNGVRIILYQSTTSNDNRIYHNNFINNSEYNALDICNNYWDNGYPSGGNYWDDYNGIDADGDGIGDTPYNISGGTNQDLYPLIYTFEMYYVLGIKLDTTTINEGTVFDVTVKTIGGTSVPEAQVEFNNETKTTDSSGVAKFIAPQLDIDTYFEIIAIKHGYTKANETILVKNVPLWINDILIIGLITNSTTVDQYITFDTVLTLGIILNPFNLTIYTPSKKLTISIDYIGLVGSGYILAFCDLLV